MAPRPEAGPRRHPGGRLAGRRALVSGGDSGIGRAVALAFAAEGADVAILYLDEHGDADETVARIEEEGRRGLAIAGDISQKRHCDEAVAQVAGRLGGIDVLVNNAAEQHQVSDVSEITEEQLERTFRTNIFSMFFMTQAALPHMGEGGAIVNTTSVTAYNGNPSLIDYSATKGAIVAYTRSLSAALVDRGIRVNAVAPGPIWTPLIPATFDADSVESFGANVPMGRPGEPAEVAPSYVFLASDDASYMSGQVLHPNGGTIVGG